mgnify:CR=1 FL=1
MLFRSVYYSPEIGAYLNSSGNVITEAEALNAANQAATAGAATGGGGVADLVSGAAEGAFPGASAGTVASDAMALICEDPEAVLQVTLTNAGTAYTSGAATVAAVGKNIGYYQPATAVNTSTGNSAVSANFASAATTATLPFRIIDVVKESALSDGTFAQVLVSYQLGVHFYRQTTGA